MANADSAIPCEQIQLPQRPASEKKSLHDKNPIQNLAHRREHLEEVQKSKPTALQRAREVHKHTTLGNPHLVQFHLITKN